MPTDERMGVFDWITANDAFLLEAKVGLLLGRVDDRECLEVLAERWRKSVICLYKVDQSKGLLHRGGRTDL